MLGSVMTKPASILYCHCRYAQVVPAAVKESVLKRLCESGVDFFAVADLCEQAARCDPALKEFALGANGPIRIAACYPRAVKWLFAAADAPLPANDVRIFNMRAHDALEVSEGLLEPATDPAPAKT